MDYIEMAELYAQLSAEELAEQVKELTDKEAAWRDRNECARCQHASGPHHHDGALLSCLYAKCECPKHERRSDVIALDLRVYRLQLTDGF